MDGTLPTSNTATRKRRSSILKGQRPPRTPFSELEFNVATPTDASKSRRVSFSRRTGVAEFVTNEATTTWKNFYEEQNKSLESSGQDEAQHPRPTLGHLGNRLFDQQFQDVEAEIDFVGNLGAPRSVTVNNSLSHVNITQQIALLECTEDDKKPIAPENNFELSAFTETKVLVNDLTNPMLGETSGRIDINFSAMNSMCGTQGDKDDLDEIERDLEISRPNVVCHGPYSGDMSQYIEVDLNTTQGPIRNINESDMSITDTIHSPKKEVSASISQLSERNSKILEYKVEDKENIIINPYVSPAESDNFAVNDESEKILVFDGKKLKYADINADLDEIVDSDIKKSLNKSLLNLPPENIQNVTVNMSMTKVVAAQTKRQTIVFNEDDVNADISVTQCIPNIIQENQVSVDMSMTRGIPGVLQQEPRKRQTIVFENDDVDADISVTQCIPNILKVGQPKRQTIVFENDDIDADISVTQCVPNIVNVNQPPANMSITCAVPNTVPPHKRQTIVFDNDGDVSFTQCIPNSIKGNPIIPNEADKENNAAIPETVMPKNNINRKSTQTHNVTGCTKFIDELLMDMSMTKALPTSANIAANAENMNKPTKRQTIVFDNNDSLADISVTQCVSNLRSLLEKSTKEDNIADMSVTQAVPSKMLGSMLNENDNCDSDGNKPLPADTLKEDVPVRRKTILFEDADVSITQVIPTERKTIIFENDSAKLLPTEELQEDAPAKIKTLIFNDADVSMTQAIPSKTERKTTVFDDDAAHTKTMPAGTLQEDAPARRKTLIFNDADVSMTQAVPSKTERKTTVFDDDAADTKPLPADTLQEDPPARRKTIIFDDAKSERKTKVFENDVAHTKPLPAGTLQEDAPARRKTIIFNDADVSMTQVVPSKTDRKTIVFEDDAADIKPLPTDAMQEDAPARRKTIIFDDAEVSMTQVIPSNSERKTISFEDNAADISNTKPIPAQLLSNDFSTTSIRVESVEKIVSEEYKSCQSLLSQKQNSIIVYQATTETIPCNRETKNVSVYVTSEKLSTYYTSHVVANQHASQTFLEVGERTSSESPTTMTNLFNQDLHGSSTTDDDSKSDNKTAPAPSSKGDEFHASSQKIETDTENLGELTNPHVTSYSQKAPKVHTKKVAEQVESKLEEPIKSISYDKMESSVTKIVNEDTSNVNVSQRFISKSLHELEPTSSTAVKEDDIEMTQASPLKESQSHHALETKLKKSLLTDLLNMSDVSMADGIDDKATMATEEPEQEPEPEQEKEPKAKIERDSNASLFLIIRDSKEEVAPANNVLENKSSIVNEEVASPLALEYKEDSEQIDEEENESEAKSIWQKIKSLKLKKAKPEVTQESAESVDKSPFKPIDVTKTIKSFKDVDDTRSLLEMLSQLSDKSSHDLIINKSQIAIEDKTDVQEPTNKRLSFAPKLQTVYGNNEDVNRVSSRRKSIEKEQKSSDSGDDEYVAETPAVKVVPTKKSVRMSNDIVKTLTFEDESESDTNSRTSIQKISPIKKTAFGETSYMKEYKAKVIPSFLNNVSDEVKELMDDLVKPTSDAVPFDISLSRPIGKNPSTCSTQIQANLISSSQIDIDVDSVSNVVSNTDVRLNSLTSEIVKHGNLSVSRALRNDINPVSRPTSMKSTVYEMDKTSEDYDYSNDDQPTYAAPQLDAVVVFDQNNPLNNIMLAPRFFSDAHPYNPKKSFEKLQDTASSDRRDNIIDVERVSTIYDIQNDGYNMKRVDYDNISITSKPGSVDQFVDVKVVEVVDSEMNTVIAMKDAKKLLEVNSSLTLVDDSDARILSEMDVDFEPVSVKSPGRAIYEMDSKGAITKVNMHKKNEQQEKTRKRIYSPTKHKVSPLSKMDTTPKPVSKLQRIYKSPVSSTTVASANTSDSVRKANKSETKAKSPSKSKTPEKKSPRQTKSNPERKKQREVTVQQLLTQFNSITQKIPKTKHSHISKIESVSSEISTINDLTDDERSASTLSNQKSSNEIYKIEAVSSENMCELIDGKSVMTIGSSVPSILVVDDIKEALNYSHECLNPSLMGFGGAYDPSCNVIAKIDILPFMGSSICEWDTNATVGDTLSWRLLKGRLRLRARLRHRLDNAPRTYVRADTLLETLEVERVDHPNDNALARLCVTYAYEAIRWVLNRARAAAAAGCIAEDGADIDAAVDDASEAAMSAGALCGAVRRAGGVARAALRWARLMHEARLRLACTCTSRGAITLKVANVPLRTVWSVSVSAALCAGGAGALPSPRAAAVRARPVLGAARVPDHELAALAARLPPDWGHVPNTLWKVFKYLKNRRADGESLAGLRS